MSEWVLIWNDEFDNETVDTNKWEIEDERERKECHGKNRIFLFEMRANLVLCISMPYNSIQFII
jgi:hypothetical protein